MKAPDKSVAKSALAHLKVPDFVCVYCHHRTEEGDIVKVHSRGADVRTCPECGVDCIVKNEFAALLDLLHEERFGEGKLPMPTEGEAGTKRDKGKRDWTLLDPLRKYVEQVVDVVVFGAQKYTPHDWQKVRPTSRYRAALERHWYSYVQGEKVDPESGLPTLAHVICSALFLMWFDENEHPQE